MDASALRDTIPENARAALAPTAKGARVRRRAVALGGFSFLVVGFLVVIGLGRMIALVLAVAAAAGIAVVIGRSLRGRGGDVRHAAGAVQSAAGSAARRPVASFRTRTATRREQRRERTRARDRHKTANRLNARGVELRRQGDPTGAVEAHRTALELAHAAGDPRTEAMTLNNLGLALAHAGDERAAIDHFDASVAILREIDDAHHEGQVLANLGFLHGRNGRNEQAVYCLEAALERLKPDSRAFRHVEEQLRRAS
jgi:tetratricopeptide (TPR) repeat protein